MAYKSGMGWYMDMVRAKAEERLNSEIITESEYLETLNKLGSVEALLSRANLETQAA